MRYVIMANGSGTRWKMFQGIPKHLIEVDGETLLQRTTRLIKHEDPSAEVVISSSNPDCVALGARRYEPLRNELEIDRFVPELMCDDMAFLYGDTFYTEEAISEICSSEADPLKFFGNEKSIVAIKVGDSSFMKDAFEKVRADYLEGRIDACKGWQVYHHYLHDRHGMLVSRIHQIGPDFVEISDSTGDFNTPEDWLDFCDHIHLG